MGGIDMARVKTVSGVIYQNGKQRKAANLTVRISRKVTGGTISLCSDEDGIMLAVPLEQIKEYIVMRWEE